MIGLIIDALFSVLFKKVKRGVENLF